MPEVNQSKIQYASDLVPEPQKRLRHPSACRTELEIQGWRTETYSSLKSNQVDILGETAREECFI